MDCIILGEGMKALAAVAVLLGALCASKDGARADDAAASYPTRPVRIIVPYPAGSLIDLFGRLIAERLQRSLGQPFIVDNRPGGSTLLGARQVSGADKDGYTLL